MNGTCLKRFLIIGLALLIGFTASAQTMADDAKSWAEGWKYAFSQEGRQHWTPEFTVRMTAGFFTTGPEFTGGVRIDNKRTIGLLVGQGDLYIDKVPAHVYSISSGLYMRRYFHLNKKDIFAFYSDAAIGTRVLYRVNWSTPVNVGSDEGVEEAAYKPGEVWFFAAWEPGVRIRCWRNLHLFLGPTIATDCIGFHAGIGF